MEVWLSLTDILLMLLFSWPAASAFPCYAATRLAVYRGTQITYSQSYISFSKYQKVNQYLGIPYAKPPVGPLRFKNPEPVGLMTDIYPAETFKADCYQFFNTISYPWGYTDNTFPNEDCLYLNIWVPVKNSDSGFLPLPSVLPVLFWIHGGDFTVGTSRDPLYNGLTMAAEGGVIVVTINYRLGVLGFLTSGTEEAPGNYGMYDMLEALKWVNQNIAAFGGDPNQVTLAGQGAGAIATGLLCVSPLARPYFHRVIMESGSPAYTLADNSTEDSVATSQRLAEAVGCAPDNRTIDEFPESVMNCMRGKSGQLLTATLFNFYPNLPRSFLPRYGDEILPRNAREALIDGNFTHVPVLIGNNDGDGAFLLTTAYPEHYDYRGTRTRLVKKPEARSILSDFFRDLPDPEGAADYYVGKVEDRFGLNTEMYTAMGDFTFLCPSVFFAESYSRAGNDVHFYYFTHRPSFTRWGDWMGAVHFDEVQFVFGLPLQKPTYTAGEVMLSQLMVDVWTNFVKNGTTGVRNWPKYSRENPVYLNLNAQRSDPSQNKSERLGTGPHKDNCDFFRSYFGFN